uniref:WASC4 n=1 Tax=Syphacia muris TaxID=451379 RepID=A0A0N5A8F5_9BILA
LPSLSKVSSLNRSLHGTNPQSRDGESSLELEAIAAVHELSFAVQSISVSEMLPRTSELIFVNVTTLEAINLKNLNNLLDLFTTYYDTLYGLMDALSPGYRDRFSEKVAQKLELLQTGENEEVRPSSLVTCTPKFNEPEYRSLPQSPAQTFPFLDQESPVTLKIQVP